MPRIRQLPAGVVNQIAAGEVIERPASIVKELVENSVDALATRISVEVTRGGLDVVRVTDNGEGIDPDDLVLAVTSHATSKIADPADLFRVRTMGFRGEALASIASVSRFSLRSRTESSENAFEVTSCDHVVEPPRACGGPIGTTVEVRDLFHNTPVRRKFLKSVSTEFGHICEQFTRIAIANPRLHAVLRHNDRVVFELPPTERLLDRLVLFHGSELAEKLIWVESAANGIKVWGYVGHPSLSKPSRKGQYLFLNGRWIQDRSLQHALGEAYRGLLMVGRYPIAYLFIELPPELVDVNVHPTKAEVRFEDGSSVYRQLLSTLRTRFLSLDFETVARLPAGHGTPSEPVAEERRQELQAEFSSWAESALSAWTPDLSDANVAPHEATDASSVDRSGIVAPPASTGTSFPERNAAPSPEINDVSHGPPSPSPFSRSRAMQVLDTYLVVETDRGLTVIDQHALHERIMYEHFRRKTLAGAVETQRLLAPEPVELSPQESALLIAHRETLLQIGYVLDEFGRNTVLLSGYPAMLAKADHHAILRDLADGLAEANGPNRRDLLDKLLHMMSCKAAIKAGQRLADDEIQSLISQRHLVDDAHHCPHGRPTALVLSRDQLDRQFGRLG
ncbi:MAG: DNA mismatch repair endonuclease MutL [Planctomycetota bacterium]|nr:DNA mismatch repair endonuclease MutL [Planctomycetaceae bacterium]MDQ3331704.1 DNA mismatch repair endonuclease MutL [Planctomycetota bacterium]